MKYAICKKLTVLSLLFMALTPLVAGCVTENPQDSSTKQETSAEITKPTKISEERAKEVAEQVCSNQIKSDFKGCDEADQASLAAVFQAIKGGVACQEAFAKATVECSTSSNDLIRCAASKFSEECRKANPLVGGGKGSDNREETGT